MALDDEDDLLEIKCQLESQTAWRKVYIAPTSTYEQFLTAASEEFGQPVVVYEYKDPMGDTITHDQDRPIVGWVRLLKFLNKQLEMGQYAEMKVFVRPGRRKSVEAASPLVRRGSSDVVPTPNANGATSPTGANSSPTLGASTGSRGSVGSSSGSRAMLVNSSRGSVIVSPPVPAGTNATAVEFSPPISPTSGGFSSPTSSGDASRRAKSPLDASASANNLAVNRRGSGAGDEDLPIFAQRRVSDAGPSRGSFTSPRSPVDAFRRSSVDSLGDRRGSTGSIDEDDEIQILEDAKLEYINEVMGSPALSRTPPSMPSLLGGGNDSDGAAGSDDEDLPEFLRSPSPSDFPIASNGEVPAGRDSDGIAVVPPLLPAVIEQPRKHSSGKKEKEKEKEKEKTTSKKRTRSNSTGKDKEPRRSKSVSRDDAPKEIFVEQQPAPLMKQKSKQKVAKTPSPAAAPSSAAASNSPTTGKRSTATTGKTASSKRASKSLENGENSAAVGFTWKKGALLGKGAFGNVYKGFTSTGQLIAVKHLELSPDTNLEKNTHYMSFKKEIDLLKSFRHPNIVRYFGSQVDKNNVYVFLEYAPGGSISSLLTQYGSFHESLIKVYAKDILLGLKYLHENGVAHRDIKGGNILVDTTGHAKLADFGCSKSMSGLATQDQQFNTMLGTPYWMAPEVMRQQPGGYDGRKADIWSFACTIIEMAAGKPPWADEFTQVAALVFAIATTEATPAIPEQLSEECHNFLASCLKREPNSRPSAEELLRHPWLTSARESHRYATLSQTQLLASGTSDSGSTTPRSLTGSSGGGGGLRTSGKSNMLAMSRDREGRTGLFEISLSASLTQAVVFAQAQFETLPTEVAYGVFRLLSLRDLLAVSQVCAQWRQLVHSNNKIWKELSIRMWPKIKRTVGGLLPSPIESSNSSSEDSIVDEDSPSNRDKWMRLTVQRAQYDRLWQDQPHSKIVQIGQLKGHQKHIYSAQLVAGGTKVITGSADRKVKLWELGPSSSASKASVTLKGHSGSVKCVHASQNIAFSGSSDTTIKVWDLHARKCVLTLKSHEDVVASLQFDKNKLVSGSLDGSVRVFDLTSGTTLRDTLLARSGVNCIRFWRELIVSGCADGSMQLWDLRAAKSGSPVRTFAKVHSDEVSCVDFMNEVIISGSYDGTVREWSPSMDAPQGLFQLPAGDVISGGSSAAEPSSSKNSHKSSPRIHSVLFDGINNVAAARSDGRVTLWSYHKEQSYATIRASDSSASAVLSIDWQGDYIVSAGQDKLAKLWNVRSDKINKKAM